jgi:hypothetical protein
MVDPRIPEPTEPEQKPDPLTSTQETRVES